jgi:hypothetical protein
MHKNSQLIKCNECGWGLTITTADPNPEKLRRVLNQQKLKKIKTDGEKSIDLSNTSFDPER